MAPVDLRVYFRLYQTNVGIMKKTKNPDQERVPPVISDISAIW